MPKSNTRAAPAPADPLIRFERLLAELSASFVNLPAADVDDAINDALRKIADVLGVDRSQLISFSVIDDALVTHSGALNGVPSVSPKSIADAFPWSLERLRKGHPVVLRTLDDLPADACEDAATFRRIGTQSSLTMPLRVAGRVEGAIAFGCLNRKHDWPEELVERIGVLADVFGNALAHKRTREALDAAIGFERAVSDTLRELLTAGRSDRDWVIETGLGRFARILRVERATLWLRTGDSVDFVKTHRWLADSVPTPLPDTVPAIAVPWISAQLAAGSLVRFGRHADLPAEASADVPALRALHIRAAVIVPLTVSDAVVGALSFATASEDRRWPDALIPRVALLGDVYAGVLARDAAERREKEAQAQAAHAARVGTMGMFAASLVHELTQPLAAGLANAETAVELLAASSPDLEELRSTLADIVSDDRRIGDLVQQLRRFLRRGETEKSELDIREVIAEIFRLVEKDAAAKAIDIRLEVPASLPNLVGDRVQLQQVMLNLVLNAFDAVEACEPGTRRVALIAAALDEGLSIEVTDSGHGMDDQTIARVFQPFFTTKSGGMGLGLSISRSIVVAHGGRLSVRSAPSVGTTFRMELPSRARGAVPLAPRAVPVKSVAGTVFVIDDDPSMRRALERQLRSAGYKVDEFASAEEYLQRAPDAEIACIVSDVRMPGASGLDLQATLAEKGRALPMVFISGHGDVPITARALKAGAVNFLAKPFSKSDLLAAVAEALARSEAMVSDRKASRELDARYDALTPREREVFALVAAGLLNKVIADRLGAAEATIKIHRGRVMEKMGATSVADLVRLAESLAQMRPGRNTKIV
jgi:FixJ family two-component response regulator/signal transduction histidine kinase